MVVPNAKLKRKKREEAAATADLAPPPDSTAVPSSESPSKGDTTAVELSKKKKRKGKKPAESKGHSADGDGGMDVDDDPVKSRAVSEASELPEAEHENGDAAAEATQNGAHVQGDERIPEGGRKNKKKKKKLTDRWGKNLDDADVVDDEHFEERSASQEAPRQEEKVDPKKIMVGGMPYYITEDDIHEFFQECGAISELDCMTFPDTGKFKGIAFITFKTEEAAEQAIALDGADMGGRFLKIEICKIKPKEPAKKEAYREPPKKHAGCLSAYIGNLAWDISEKELRRFFKGSKIDSIRLAVDKETGGFRGFGHVDFADDKSLEAAMKLDQKEVLGRPLKIAYSVPQKLRYGEGERQGHGDSAGKKGCYTCGEDGHKSYNCPKKPLAY